MPTFKIGDRVETLDGVGTGTVIEIVTYNDETQSQTLLAIELWRKIPNARSKK